MDILMIDRNTPSRTKAEANIQIDYITRCGSAFAFCENGDQVFLNARIVDKMELDEGDHCRALLLENFEDKKDITPWRAVRVSTAA